MEFRQLATDLTVFLSPFIPYLLKGAEEVAKEFGKKLGEDGWEKAKLIWAKLRNSTNNDPKFETAVLCLKDEPDDVDYQAILAKALAKKLKASPELASELLQMLQDDKSVQDILVEREGTVRDVYQRLGKSGRQKAVIRGRARDINQEQSLS